YGDRFTWGVGGDDGLPDWGEEGGEEWQLAPDFTGDANVQTALGLCSALAGASTKEQIQAARAAYSAIPATFWNMAYARYLFQNYEPYKSAYDKLVAAEREAGMYDPLPDVTYAEALAGALDYIKAQAPAFGTVGGEWAALALARGGAITESYKTAYLAALDAALAGGAPGTASQTDKARIALALTSLGIDASDYNGADLIAEMEEATHPTINGEIFALLALNSRQYESGARGEIAFEYDDEIGAEIETISDGYIKAILDAQLPDGGWSVDSGEWASSGVDLTAMAAQALAPYYQTSAAVHGAIDAALEYLKGEQITSNGGFGFGSDPANSTESDAQVIVALTALGIDPTGGDWEQPGGHNPLTAMLQNYDEDGGGFGSTDSAANAMSTEQAAYALVAYDRFANLKNHLYNMTDADGSVVDDPESGAVEDDEAIAAALALLDETPFAILQADANTEAAAKAKVEAIIGDLSLNGVAAAVDGGAFVAAVAGNESDPDGADGSLAFSVTLSRGDGADQTFSGTLAIAATPYTAPGAPVGAAVTIQLDASGLLLAKQAFAVEADLSERHGYGDAHGGARATPLDALVAAHIAMFGDEDLDDWLQVSAGGFVTLLAGEPFSNSVFFVNGAIPGSETVATAVLAPGDDLLFYLLQDPFAMTDTVAWFADAGGEPLGAVAIEEGEELGVTLVGYWVSWPVNSVAPENWRIEPIEDAQIAALELNDEAGIRVAWFGEEFGLTDEDGRLGITFDEPGEYILSAYDGADDIAIIAPWLAVTVTARAQPQDDADIAAALALLGETGFAASQAEAGSAEAAKASVEAIIGGLKSELNGVAAAVEGGAFVAATAGTLGNAGGADGSLAFTVTLSKGDGAEQAFSGTLAIAAAPYVAPEDMITVAATVEKFRVAAERGGGGYFIEPTLIQIPKASNAAYAIARLLADNGIAYVNTGTINSSFYLTGIRDSNYTEPDSSTKKDGYLGEFDEETGAGWMFSVNNVFPGVGASAVFLNDGDVMRWQYTLDTEGKSLVGENKDALTAKVAQIRAAGQEAAYGAAYAGAMAVLTNMSATGEQIAGALAALDAGIVDRGALGAKIAEAGSAKAGISVGDGNGQ
ncbi:MAG: DUF4430 domain-containing protein, partial [Clostridiales bacterium]|nr:DUF4430 domain-containing protein [Clostridiales bacterium]